jgi:hypothetical protein
MRITMLGHSGVGKTTYMAAMYDQLQQPINGFSLKADDNDDHRRLKALAKDLMRGIYPKPSDQRAEYDFALHFEGEHVWPFVWVDYRGGALTERSTSQQKMELLSDLKRADGVMLFYDAPALVKGRVRSSEIGTMMTLTVQALQNSSQVKPVVILMTKADLLDDLNSDIIKPLEGLMEAIAANQKVLATLIPVACGQERINVELPVLFALRMGIMIRVTELHQTIQRIRAEGQFWIDRGNTLGGFFGDLFNTVVGEKTTGDRAREIYRKAVIEAEKHDKLVDPANALNQYLDGLPVF